MFNVNFVGSRILELLKSGSTESSIVDEIGREFGVRRELAENDVREFLQSLKKFYLVEEQEACCFGLSWDSRSWDRHGSLIGRSIARLCSGGRNELFTTLLTGGVNEVCTMSFLILKAYLMLIRFDLYLARGNFAAVYDKVANYPVGKTPAPDAVERICSAVDMACIWYWKEARCLQRSAATSYFLKSVRDIPAQMVNGHNSCHSRRMLGSRWMVAVSTTNRTCRKYTQCLDRC